MPSRHSFLLESLLNFILRSVACQCNPIVVVSRLEVLLKREEKSSSAPRAECQIGERGD